MSEPGIQPIIIKRIKKGGHGHHGGAWKVAYADFVTAMMAFFLLLWLLSTTTPEQKMGLAEYFTPTIGIKDSMGIGFKGGLSPNTEGRARTDLSAPGLVIGQVQQGPTPKTPDAPNTKIDENEPATTEETAPKASAEDAEQFKESEEQIKQSLQEDPELKEYQNNVVVQDTPEGLKINMIDDQKKPMFMPGGAVLTDMGKKVLDSMVSIIIKTPNNITISGHTDVAGSTLNANYTNWELSADRANSARRFLSATQLEPDRVAKVEGMSDRELLVPQEPTSPRNRRITIIIMRGSYFRDPKTVPTTRTLLSVPDSESGKPVEMPEEAPPQEAAPEAGGEPPPQEEEEEQQ